MIHTHMPHTPRFRWLKQLAAIASGLVLTSLASAGSVSITGTVSASCSSWSSVSGDGTNITYVCGTAQTSGPGQFTLTVPTSLAANRSYLLTESNIVVSRTGGNVDATVNVSASGGGCTSTTGSINFVGTSGAAQGVQLTTTTGTCTIGITVPSGGTANGPTSKSISLVNPAANVVLSFELAQIAPTTFGASSAAPGPYSSGRRT